MIRLTVEDGNIVQTLSLSGEKVFIGRLESNTIRLSHPSVSRKHAMIRTTGGGVELLDLNSRHGVRKNGETVARTALAAGDRLEVGEVKIRVESVPGAPAPKPSAAAPAASAGAVDAKILLSDVHRTSFSQELYRTLRQTPWWAASLCAHAIFVYLLFAIPFLNPTGEEGLGLMKGRMTEDFSSLLEKTPLSADRLRERAESESEPRRAPPVEEMPVPIEPLEPLEEMEEPRTPELGPATMDFSSNPLKSSPFSSAKLPDVEFGQEGAESANEQAGSLLKKAMLGRPGDTLGVLNGMPASQVLVVSGHYDRVEAILDLFDVRRQEMTVRTLDREDFADRKILILNCSNERPSRQTVLRIREFVQAGGYLLTTDWGVENVLRDAFPGYVEPLLEKGRNVITPNEVIRIHAAPDKKAHFLLAGTSLGEGETKWWLEESSYPFLVKRPAEVEVLIESADLEREYGTRAVAVTFPYGKGRVLHMLGHFFQKEGNLRGAFSTQRMIANFIVAAVRKR